MVKEYEDIIQPPEKFRDGYKPIPKPMTDRPLQMRGNQNARSPPKPQRLSPPPPKREHEEPDSITDKPSSKIRNFVELLRDMRSRMR